MREIPSFKNLVLPLVLVGALFIAQLQRAQEKIPTWVFEGQIMGTTFTVKAIAPTEPKLELITDALEAVNERMSTYIDSSELSQINQNSSPEPIKISDPLKQVLMAAKKVTKQSQGAFDISVGPLVNAWGFGPNKERKLPSAEQIAELKELSGDELWTLEANHLTKLNPKLYLDLSAIAKGYAVDQVAQALEKAKVERYLVEVGGEIRVKGLNANQGDWRIGIDRPAPNESRRKFQVINLHNTSIATSGDYRNRYIDQQGKVRSHTIDPSTGEPITHTLASVSVLHPECMYADAWATALNVLGAERGLALANQLKLAAIFITREGINEKALELDQESTRYVAVMSEAMKAYLASRTDQ